MAVSSCPHSPHSGKSVPRTIACFNNKELFAVLIPMKTAFQKTMPILAALMVIGVLPAEAGTYTYGTKPGATTAEPVNAEAIFTTGSGTLTITLKNLESNPTDVTQNISDLSFTLANGTNTGFTLSTSSGQEVSVGKKGVVSLGSTVATGWDLGTTGTTGATLDVLGSKVGPSHLIIGAPDTNNVYSNANGSIANNNAHNPFLYKSATFTITGSDITASTTITGASFSFGTTPGQYSIPGRLVAVPEPGTLVLGLIATGLIGSIAIHRRRRAD